MQSAQILQLRSAVASNPLKTLYSTDFAVNNMKPSMDFGGFGLRAQVNCLVKFQPWGCYVFEPLRLYEERAATKSKKDELQDQLSVQKLEQWSRQLCNTRSSWISALYAHLVLQLYIQYSAVCCPIWTMYLVMLRVILQYAHTSRFSQGSFSQCYKCEQTALLAFVKCIWRCIPTTGRNIQKNAKDNERNKTHPTLGELPQRMEQWNPHNETTLGKVVGMLKKPWH